MMDLVQKLQQRNTLAGIGWMLITGWMFVAVTGIVRHLGSDLPAVEAAFIRYVFGLMLIIPILIKVGGHWPRGRVLGLFVLRGAVHGAAVMLWFFAMARIPIAEVTAIGYTAPVFTALGAALFLGERLNGRRMVAVLLGFAGTLVILRPGMVEIQIGALAQLAAAPLFAASFIMAKKLTETHSPAVIVAMLSVFCTIALIPGTVLEWRTPTLIELFWLFLTAVFATLGHYTLTRAFQAAPITVTQPVSYLQLIWATLLGVALFGEPVDPWLFVGGAIIVFAATWLSHRETRKEIPPSGVAS